MKMNYINQKNLNIIKDYIGDNRFYHSKRVMDESIKLAEVHGANIDKARIAGMFHDCGKFISKKRAYEFIKDNNLEFEKELMENFQLLHSHLGVYVAKIVFNIKDMEILNSIKYHTTSRKDPTLMDKIIYIADVIEPNRDFEGVNILRDLAYIDLDKAVYFSLNKTIKNLVDSNRYIGTESIEARNYFLNKLHS